MHFMPLPHLLEEAYILETDEPFVKGLRHERRKLGLEVSAIGFGCMLAQKAWIVA
jgi:hypothetical protein